MTLSETRWHTISESQFPWEREALSFVRERLPDHDPYLAWANFEFVGQDGGISEVDLLVLSPNGLFLVEIKSRPGLVKGDSGTWTWEWDGKVLTEDNPLLLANRKARRLGSLLRSQKAFNQVRAPFVEAVVFCSAASLKLGLDDRARQHVYLRDDPGGEGRSPRSGIVALLTTPPALGDPSARPRIDRLTARALARAMEQLGVRPTQRSRRIGDFVLDRLVFEGPGYQDYEATHVSLKGVRRRVRLYPVATGTTVLSRRTLERAAQREYQILEGIRHPGIVKAVGFTQHERGPALVFELDPGSLRMDHYLRERGDRLGIDVRLDLLRQVAEALKHAHEKRLYHRALSPQSILIADPEAATPKARLFNWQTARRDPGTSAPPGAVPTRTTHLGELVEEPARVYMAPEALRNPDADAEPMDVFSLGAIAYHLFAGRPPAANVLELGDRLRDERGLRISSVLDGAGPQLEELIFFSTCADLTTRTSSVDEFMTHLERVEEEFTAPDKQTLPDPMEAKAGDEIEGGFRVERRLGKGSSSVALLVKHGDSESVLKISLGPEHHDRLRGEAEVLGKLRHQHICALHEVLEVGGRLALRMEKAGEETLAHRLRSEGPLHIEMLERFGEDLLQTVDWLEQQGIPHRDIKPDNIGILPVGKEKRRHLVLFDFSLSRAPAENIRAGTVPYLDPFLALRKPPRWDLHAERFAAAMTLHEMATASLPIWGDGRSDPAMIDDEVAFEASRFDPDLREAMVAFFKKALRRDYRERFENTEEMLKAWRLIFAQAERRPVEEPSDDVLLGEALATATLDTPLAQLGLGTRALNALDRANALDVRGLLRLPPLAVNTMRGVGIKTRREITAVIKRLAQRFPDVPPLPQRPTAEGQTGRGKTPKRRAAKEAEVASPSAPEALGRSIDLLADVLVPRSKKASARHEEVMGLLLGLAEGSNAPQPGVWPSQTDVAAASGLTRARVGQILGHARSYWAAHPALEELAKELADMLALRGGVMSATELAVALLTARGSVHSEPKRTRLASAVGRAVVEAEAVQKEPRFGFWRSGEVVLVAQNEALADYAQRLGRKADGLATEDPPPTPGRVAEALQRVKTPEGVNPLSANRLIPLAAAASQQAAVSSRLELYPRRLDPVRAIKLARGALLGAPSLTPTQIAERVMGRYPDAQPLPPRPELDDLLDKAGVELKWDAEKKEYRAPARAGFSSLTPSLPRYPTTLSRPLEVTPEVAEARQFQARLQHAFEHGGFLVLTVDPRHLVRAEAELVRQFQLGRRSIEEVFIRAMRDEAARAGADWGVVLRADAAPKDSSDWGHLMLLVRRVVPQVESEILGASGRILLVHPGLVARYDLIDLFGRLRAALDRSGPLQALWLLVPADGASELPMLDGRPIPVLTPGQWARIPEAWLQNLHRSQIPPALGVATHA